MKKKILLSTLALTMAFSTMAALPFADQGIFKKAGITRTAEAAASASAVNNLIDKLQPRIDNIYSILDKSDIQGKEKVEAVRLAVDNTHYTPEIEAYVIKNFKELLKDTGVSGKDLFYLVKSVTEIGLGDTAQLADFRQGEKYFEQIKALSPGASSQDAIDFANIVFAELTKDAAIGNLAGAVDGDIEKAVKDYINTVFTAVLGHTDNKIVKVINSAGIKADVFTGLNDLITSAVNKEDAKAAIVAVAVAAARAELTVRSDNNPDEFVTLTTKAAGSYTDKLDSILAARASVLNKYIEWTVVTGDNLIVDKNNGKISLKNNVTGTHKGTVTAAVYAGSIKGQALFAEAMPIEVTYTASSVNPGGGGGGSSSTADLPKYDELNKDTFNELDKLTKDLANSVSAGAKAEAQAKMQQLFNDYVKAAGTVSVLGKVSDTADVAKLALTANDLKAHVAEVTKQLKAAIESFKKASPDLKIPVMAFTLDMGKTKSNVFDITLNKDLMELLKSSDMAQVRVLSKGFVTNLTVASMQADTKWTVKSAPVKQLSNVPVVASAVYDVNFAAPAALDKGAVFVNVPLSADFKLPKHSLQVASIDKGAAKNLVANKGEFEYSLTNTQTSVAITGRDVNFKDVAKVESWAGAQIEFVASLGIVDGIGKDGFAPTKVVTRAELSKMFVQAFELTSKGTSTSIKDTNSQAWYNDYVQIAVQAGLMNVNSDGTFKPNASLNRGQIAAVAARAMQQKLGWEDVKNVDEVLSVFKDADKIHPSIRKDVALAVKNNLLVGDNGMFNSTKETNRAEAAVIIARMLMNQ